MRQKLELFWEFVITDFKLRYKKSLLGVLWMVIKPLIMFYIIYNVWVVIGKTLSETAVIILIGIMLHNLFSETVMYGLSSLVNKAHIILKIYFPRYIVVFAAAFVALINFSFNLGVITLFLIFGTHLKIVEILIALLIISLAAFLIFALGSSLNLFLSILYVKFRDITHLVEVILQLLFWTTPILYDKELFKQNKIRTIIEVNPLTHIVEFTKNYLKNGNIQFDLLIYPAILSFIILILGTLFFVRKIPKIAEEY